MGSRLADAAGCPSDHNNLLAAAGSSLVMDPNGRLSQHPPAAEGLNQVDKMPAKSQQFLEVLNVTLQRVLLEMEQLLALGGIQPICGKGHSGESFLRKHAQSNRLQHLFQDFPLIELAGWASSNVPNAAPKCRGSQGR